MSEKREFWIDTTELDNGKEFTLVYEDKNVIDESYEADFTHVIEYSAYTEAISRAEKAERKLAKAVEQRDAANNAIIDRMKPREFAETIKKDLKNVLDSELEAVEGKT